MMSAQLTFSQSVIPVTLVLQNVSKFLFYGEVLVDMLGTQS